MLNKLTTNKVVVLAAFLMLLVQFSLGLEQAPQLIRAEMPNPDSFYKLVLVREYAPDTGFQYLARDNAPFGFYQHWSAVHSWVVLQLYQGLQMLGLEQNLALIFAGAALTVLSMLLLTVLVVRAVAEQGSALAALVVALALISSGPLRGYGQPVQITHHIFMLLPLAAAALALLPSEKSRHDSPLWSAFGGALLALALWISPETMPLVVVLLATSVAFRIQYAMQASLWPVAAGLSGMLVFGWQLDPPPPTYSAWALDHVSLAWLLFGLLLSGLLILADALVKYRLSLRTMVSVLLAAALAAGMAWLWWVPGAAQGPEGLIPADLKPLWWEHINELQAVRSPAEFVISLVMPLVAAALMFFMALRHRALWTLVLAVSVFAYVFLAARHVRMAAAAAFLATLCYGIALAHMQAFRAPRQLHQRPWTLLATFALMLLPSLQLISAYFLLENEEAKQNKAAAKVQCKLADISAKLNALPVGTVLTSINDGPELLWRTHHRTIAGNYHHNIQGIRDLFAIWRSTGSDQQARELVDQRGIIYVLGCDQVPDKLKRHNGQPTLASRVAAGEAIDWLPRHEKLGHWHLYWRNP